jgi:hypothetical protein
VAIVPEDNGLVDRCDGIAGMRPVEVGHVLADEIYA